MARCRRSSSPRDLLLPQSWSAKDQRREVSHPVWRELLRGRAILFLDKARGPGPRLSRRLSRLAAGKRSIRSEEHTSELQSQSNLVCRLLLEKKKKNLLQTMRYINR